MELNKIFAAILTAGIIAMVAGFVADLLVEPEELEQNAYVVDTGAEPEAGGGEAPAAPTDIGVLLASADPAAGEATTRACAACHSFEQGGQNKVGPNLWNVVGRPVAAVEGFNYSAALTEHGGEWTYDELNGFILAPRDWVPGTAMSYAGLKDDQDRANLIAYLSTLSDSPVPFPAPVAETEAPAEGGAQAAEGAVGEQPVPATQEEGEQAEGGQTQGEAQESGAAEAESPETGGEPTQPSVGATSGEAAGAKAGGSAGGVTTTGEPSADMETVPAEEVEDPAAENATPPGD